jgi:NADPH2:quinone reductase
VVYDGVGKKAYPGSLECLRPLGTFVSFGSASGAIDAFDIGLLRHGSLYATRPTLGAFMADRERADKMARDLFKVVGAGEVTIEIDKRLPLSEAAEAHRAFEARDSVVSFILLP